MRGTRAIQMGVGVGLIIGVFYLSEWWHLDTVNWLIRNIAGYVVFAAIVVFQSEIRRTLAHLRPGPLLPLPHADGVERRGRRGTGGRRDDARQHADRRDHRGRARHRPAQLHRGRRAAGRDADLGPAAERLPATVAAPRRCDHRAGRPRGGGGLLPAAVGEPRDQQGLRHAAPCRHRSDRGRGRGDHRRFRGDRSHLGRAGRSDRVGLDADRLRARLRTLVPLRKAVPERTSAESID